MTTTLVLIPNPVATVVRRLAPPSTAMAMAMATAVVATSAASAVAVMALGVVVEAEQDARRGQAGPTTPYTAGRLGVEMLGGVLVTEVAYLASGRWAAVRVGLVMLYARGLLDTGRRGRIGRVGSSPRTGEPLERALFASLLGWSGAREVGASPRVLVTQRELRRGLERRSLLRRWWVRVLVPLGLAVLPGVLAARLVSLDVIGPQVGVLGVVVCATVAVWFLPRRTVAGARLLRRLRVDHADRFRPLCQDHVRHRDTGSCEAGRDGIINDRDLEHR
jgi:uncharacterized protein (TIGR04222 family)